jgi:PKD repeat protein
VTYTTPPEQDDLLVTATGYNTIPYQGNVSISTCAGPSANYGFSLSNLVATFTDGATGTGGTITHTWDFGDGTGTSSQPSPTYTYGAAGTYTVCLTVSDSCGNTELCRGITITNTVGMDEGMENAFGLHIYPNPMAEQSAVVFNLEETEEVKLSVFDLLGQETKILLREVMPAGEHAITLNAADYEKTMYFIRLKTGGQMLTKRFVVQ